MHYVNETFRVTYKVIDEQKFFLFVVKYGIEFKKIDENTYS